VSRAGAAIALAAALAPLAGAAPAAAGPIDDGVREQSCKALAASTVGLPDQAQEEPGAGPPPTWPAAPAGLLPKRVYLRTATESFNRRYAFATRHGAMYAQVPGGQWRQMPLPLCFAGRVKSISVDDDELIALDDSRRIFTMDNALKDASSFNWSSRWGTPFWAGPGYQLPGGIRAWSWSVVSPLEDGRWTDPAGNHHAIGSGKVSHIWALRSGGRRISFWDPWLPLDESYGMCAPLGGRFEAVNLSASGSTIFVIGRRGDMFTRIYDFDLSGHDRFFFHYSYEDQRGNGDGAPIQLPAARWVHQPKVPGPITRTISIHKVGRDVVHRTMRVEAPGGYWEKDVTQLDPRAWRFHATGWTARGRALPNPRRDTSRIGLGTPKTFRYAGGGLEVRGFSVHCTPARLRIGGAHPYALRLHTVDGLRQQSRAYGLDDVPREYYGDVEVPKRYLGRPFVKKRLGGRRFTDVTLQVTSRELRIEELGLTLRRKR
jgi:hypothetical protein